MGISRRTALAGLMTMVAGCTDSPRHRTGSGPVATGPVIGAPPLPPLAPMPLTRRPPAVAGPVIEPGAFGLDAVVDLSHFNRVNDFAAARESGIIGVIHKASEGGDWVDPLYTQRRAQAEAAGLLWGAYHFGTFQRSGAEQAAMFLATVQPDPHTLIALDLELNERNPSNTMDITRAEAFVRAIQNATGRLPVLYVHPAWADGEAMGGRGRTLGGVIRPGSMLAACDLWLADYRNRPELPSAWAGRGWLLWQYAGDGAAGGSFKPRTRLVSGINSCDRNLFAADRASLIAYWQRDSRFSRRR